MQSLIAGEGYLRLQGVGGRRVSEYLATLAKNDPPHFLQMPTLCVETCTCFAWGLARKLLAQICQRGTMKSHVLFSYWLKDAS
jgi:hypothetical protein